MNIRTRTLLVVALATALQAPAALAQVSPGQERQGSTRLMNRFTDLIASAAAQSSERSSEALLNTNAPIGSDSPPPVPRLNETTPPPIEEVEERAMQPAKPPGQVRDATEKSSDATQGSRGNFEQIDTNGDGRISAAEGQVVADFKANFEMMDADRDGYVSDAEFRADSNARRKDRDDAENADRKDQ